MAISVTMHSQPVNVSAFTGFSHLVDYGIKIYGIKNVEKASSLPSFDSEPDPSIYDTLSNRNVSKTIACPQGSLSCTPLFLFHEPFVLYHAYVIYLKIYNQGEQVKRGFYAPRVTFYVCWDETV